MSEYTSPEIYKLLNIQVRVGRTKTMQTVSFLGGSEMPLETFNQIHISCILPMYLQDKPKQNLRKSKMFFTTLGACRTIQSNKNFSCIVAVP